MKHNFARSYEVQQLVDFMSTLKVGDTVTYDDIEKVIGELNNANRARINSARRILLHEKQMVFGVVRKVGLVRMDDHGIVQSGAQSISRIRRESVRGLKRLACVDYQTMSQADKNKHDAAASHLGILAECSRVVAVKKIEDKVSEQAKKLTFEETLKAFRE